MSHPQPISGLIYKARRPIERPREFSRDELNAGCDRYGFDVYHQGILGVMPAVLAFREAVLTKQTPRWLTLLGPSGVGKTMLLKKLFVELAETKRWDVCDSAHIIPGEDLKEWDAPMHYARCKLVYIEDIGSGATGDKGAAAVTRSRVAELLQLRTGKWTLLCANMSISGIAQNLDARIASRLKRDGSTVVEIPAEVPDYFS